MKLTRRTLLKGALIGGSSLLLPAIKAQPQVDREKLLAAFCDEPVTYVPRYDLSAPFDYQGLVIATDAFQLVRAEISGCSHHVGERCLPLNAMDRVWKNYWRPKKWMAWERPAPATLSIKPTGYGICPHCGNRRVKLPVDAIEYDSEADRFVVMGMGDLESLDYDSDDHTIRDRSCPACQGKQYQGPTLVDVAGRKFEWWRLNAIAALPNLEIAASEYEYGISFRDRSIGFEGVALGIRG